MEVRYPGVYLTEVAFVAKTIEGVSTSTAGLTDDVGHEHWVPPTVGEAPAWTQANQHDPGTTLIELSSFLADSLLYRIDHRSERLVRHAWLETGVANGLSVVRDEPARVSVTPGEGVKPDGDPIRHEVASARLWIDLDP